jgi:hypothetical protein
MAIYGKKGVEYPQVCACCGRRTKRPAEGGERLCLACQQNTDWRKAGHDWPETPPEKCPNCNCG